MEIRPSSGCFGCCTKPTPIIAVDEPSKGLRIQGRIVRKPSISDDFWSTSTYDLENSAVQSQRSLSSISTSNPTLSQCSSTGVIANPSDFVNQGKFYSLYSFSCLIVWNQTRLQWIGSSRPRNHTQQYREPRLSWNATYESLLGTRNPFPRPIPLSEMIDFLVEVWDQEGLRLFLLASLIMPRPRGVNNHFAGLNDDDNTTQYEDVRSPFYIHYSDNSGMVLVTHPLVGSNYNTWRISVLIALTVKNKVGFVDGSISHPDSSDLLFSAWLRCNSLVKA
ncbi:hypothetical protein PTKIN_Ptkin19aG0045100 [Pterospermum kingtungense]